MDGKVEIIKNRITIRRAEIKDLNDILRLVAELYGEEQGNYGNDWSLDWVYGKGKEIIADDLENADSFVVVAEMDGNIFAVLRGSLYWDDWMSWKKGRGAELWDVFIEEGLRNRGVGAKLMKMFLDWCKVKKVDYVLVNAAAKNMEAIKFYEKFGFENNQAILEKKLK